MECRPWVKEKVADEQSLIQKTDEDQDVVNRVSFFAAKSNPGRATPQHNHVEPMNAFPKTKRLKPERNAKSSIQYWSWTKTSSYWTFSFKKSTYKAKREKVLLRTCQVGKWLLILFQLRLVWDASPKLYSRLGFPNSSIKKTCLLTTTPGPLLNIDRLWERDANLLRSKERALLVTGEKFCVSDGMKLPELKPALKQALQTPESYRALFGTNFLDSVAIGQLGSLKRAMRKNNIIVVVIDRLTTKLNGIQMFTTTSCTAAGAFL